MSAAPVAVDPFRERLLGPELAEARALLSRRGGDALLVTASALLRESGDARARFDDLAASLERALPNARLAIVESYLRQTVADPGKLANDLRSLKRAEPDVLDLAALGERLARRCDALECRVEAHLLVARMGPAPLERAQVEALIELARAPGRWSRRIEAVRHLRQLRVTEVDDDRRLRARTVLTELCSPREQRWLQPEALAALAELDAVTARAIANERLVRPLPGDDLLARAGIVLVVGLRKRARWPEVLRLAHDDPSEHVRITAARVQPDRGELARIARADPSHRVRASALVRLARKHPSLCSELLCASLVMDAHGFVVQTAAEELARLARREKVAISAPILLAVSEAARRPSLSPAVRDACREISVELQTTREVSRAVLDELAAAVEATPIGGSSHLTSERLVGLSNAALARGLVVAARHDFGLGVDRVKGGVLLHRGERTHFSLWRLLFELTHPAPDKRQGVSHLVARRLPGALRAPPSGLAEASATRVPGQRVFTAASGNWGRELPRVEDLLAQSIVTGSVTRIAGANGICTLEPPATILQRLKGTLVLLTDYAAFAETRQRALESNDALVHASYAEEVFRRTGTVLETVPHAYDVTVPVTDAAAGLAGTRLSALSPILPLTSASSPHSSLADFWENVRGLAPPSHDVGLTHLAGYGALLLGVLVARQALIRQRISATRATIPLVVGGWGTRGKSGSERLKAALLQGLGYECLVKTTGCEAMFIHAIPGLPAREVFIYRPYDKPTIWEQRSVLTLAGRLGVRAFLWECMALQPELVNLLQLQWMRDDVSTITNAYPDHEDMQGPTGLDVAQTIAEFMPLRATAFTSEVQMLPLLRAQAAARGTRLISVQPREVELISDDLRARFGHDEHPANIALVAALARRAGVPDAVAIAEMADHVVADLGALKTYPAVAWRQRHLSFTNGMGANDRAATVENWQRAGFDAAGSLRHPRGWIATVVNNRADRPARTVVFAQLLVKDIAADLHVLIGTNLAGMRRELDRALDEHLLAVSPTRNLPEQHAPREAVLIARLVLAFTRLCVHGTDTASVVSEATRKNVPVPVVQDIDRLLEPEGLESYAVAKKRVEDGLAEFDDSEKRPLVLVIARRRLLRGLQAAARSPASETSLSTLFAAGYREIFWEAAVFVPDPEVSGDQLIDFLARQLPIGASARIMGMQNIKGTGLDFVYRWVSIETVSRLCSTLKSEDRSKRQSALVALMVHDDYGVVDATFARDTVAQCREADDGSKYDAVLQKLERVVARREGPLGTKPASSWSARARQLIGETLDFVDAIRRRRMAALVLDLLSAAQISQATAARRMRRILSRSKGLWLAGDDRGR